MQPALPKEPAPEKKPIVKPPPEPKSEERKLPPHWRTAKDADGKTYFYHALTRETQWDMPSGEDKSNKQLSETPASPTPKKQMQYQAKKSKREEMIISPVKEKVRLLNFVECLFLNVVWLGSNSKYFHSLFVIYDNINRLNQPHNGHPGNGWRRAPYSILKLPVIFYLKRYRHETLTVFPSVIFVIVS